MAGTVSKKRGAGKAGVKAARRNARAKARAKAEKKTRPKARAKPPAKSPRKSSPKRPAKRRRSRASAKVSGPRYHPGPPIASEAALIEATARLLEIDPEVVARLVEVGGPPGLRSRETGFSGLAAIIVSQQVSVASASAIFGRLAAELAPLSAETLAAVNDATLARCGLSRPKIRALRALAEAITAGLDLDALSALEAHIAHETLVAVKGIGPWTADLFLLSCLGHPDAFPAGDLALQEATRMALGLRQRPDARKLEAIAERWRPLRGVAARMLWAYFRGMKQRAGAIGQ
jgi:DNA-3-methyladenine glycosylase II